MMYFIMLPCYLIVLGAYWYSMNYITKPDGYVLLGVKLPKEEMQSEEIQKFVRTYKKRERSIILVMFLLTLAAFFLRKYPMISTIYCMAWVFFGLGLMQILLNKTYDEVYGYKKSKGWVVGDCFTISVDTEVSRLKEKFLFPVWHWFVIGLITGAGCLLWYRNQSSDSAGYVMIGVNSSVTLVLFGLYFLMQRAKSTVYSTDSEINIAMNRCFSYNLTKAMVLCGYVNSTGWMLAGLVTEIEYLYGAILVAAIVTSFLSCGILFLAFYHIRREHRLFSDAAGGTECTVDDDIYWRGGQYNNPNDPKLWVKKRLGVGLQTNNAHLAAKIMNAAVTALMIGMFAWMIYEIPLDFPSLSLQVDQNSIQIKATRYQDEIAFADITKAECITELPRMYKNNGYADGEYDFGQFRVIDYGKCKVYITKEQKEYFVLYAGDTIYIVNSDDSEEMQLCRARLQESGLMVQE